MEEPGSSVLITLLFCSTGNLWLFESHSLFPPSQSLLITIHFQKGKYLPLIDGHSNQSENIPVLWNIFRGNTHEVAGELLTCSGNTLSSISPCLSQGLTFPNLVFHLLLLQTLSTSLCQCQVLSFVWWSQSPQRRPFLHPEALQ